MNWDLYTCEMDDGDFKIKERLLRDRIARCSFQHIIREGNMVEDKFSKLGLNLFQP